MRISFNDEPVHVVARRINDGELALVRGITEHGVAHAIISQTDDCVCIEAVEGPGGTLLTAALVAEATRNGYHCEAWVLNKGRARLARRAGMYETGETRISGSGRPQLQVATQ